MVLARNTISGRIADVSPKMLRHPHFKDYLEVVEDDAKPYVPELYKPGTTQEKKAARKTKAAKVEAPVESEVEIEAVEVEPAVEESIEIEEEN